jgi:soluble lytic murein transglycosylase-like protein
MQFKSVFCVALLASACAVGTTIAEEAIESRAVQSSVLETSSPIAAHQIDSSGLTAIVDREAIAQGVPVAVARAVVRIESRWNPRVTGRAGEVGLFQIKHASARAMGFTGSRGELYDPAINARYGMKYLAEAWRLAGGDLCRTILKYQGGHYAQRMTSASSAYCSKVRVVMASK